MRPFPPPQLLSPRASRPVITKEAREVILMFPKKYDNHDSIRTLGAVQEGCLANRLTAVSPLGVKPSRAHPVPLRRLMVHLGAAGPAARRKSTSSDSSGGSVRPGGTWWIY